MYELITDHKNQTSLCYDIHSNEGNNYRRESICLGILKFNYLICVTYFDVASQYFTMEIVSRSENVGVRNDTAKNIEELLIHLILISVCYRRILLKYVAENESERSVLEDARAKINRKVQSEKSRQ